MNKCTLKTNKKIMDSITKNHNKNPKTIFFIKYVDKENSYNKMEELKSEKDYYFNKIQSIFPFIKITNSINENHSGPILGRFEIEFQIEVEDAPYYKIQIPNRDTITLIASVDENMRYFISYIICFQYNLFTPYTICELGEPDVKNEYADYNNNILRHMNLSLLKSKVEYANFYSDNSMITEATNIVSMDGFSQNLSNYENALTELDKQWEDLSKKHPEDIHIKNIVKSNKLKKRWENLI